MKILFDHQMFTIQRLGGITRIFIELMKHLPQNPDCRIYWHRGIHIDSYDIDEFRKKLSAYWGLKAKRIQHKKEWINQFNRYSFKLFTKLHLNSRTIFHPTYYDADVLKQANPKKMAITVHDMIPELFLASEQKFPQFQKVIRDKKMYIEKADLIFVNSISTKNDLLALSNVDPAKIILTYWATGIGETVKIASLPDFARKPFFLYVGTRSKYKNFQALVNAFSISDKLKENFNVICFGGTSDFLKPELQIFSKNGLTGNFYYMDGDDSVLKALYEQAAALVYPSRYEGFGLPPLEAMTCGCPVICCNHSSIPEVVGDNAIFFEPDSTDQLVQCLLQSLEDQTLRQTLIQNGIQRSKLFSWKKAAEETLNGYRQLFH